MLSGPEKSPQSGNQPKQLVIFLHGLGSDGNDLISLADYFADSLPDAQFLSPNAPFPCDMAPFGYQWFSLLEREEDIIYDGVQTAAPILNSYIDEQLDRFSVEPENLYLIGFSQGTMMSLYVAPRRAKEIGGVIGYSGALVKPDILADETTSKPPVCLIHGNMDDVVPYIELQKAETALQHAGINVATHTCPMLGHGIDPSGIEVGKSFLETVDR